MKPWKYITHEPINETDVLQRVEVSPAEGAVVLFAGRVRQDIMDGRRVTAIYYDCYEQMAEAECRKIKEEIEARFPPVKVLIQHRAGAVPVGETALLVVVRAPHRQEAFAAIQYAIEEVKRRVPIWKKEIFDDGSWRWQEGTPLPQQASSTAQEHEMSTHGRND